MIRKVLYRFLSEISADLLFLFQSQSAHLVLQSHKSFTHTTLSAEFKNKLDLWFATNKSGSIMTDRLLLMHLQKRNKQSKSIANGLKFTAPSPRVH